VRSELLPEDKLKAIEELSAGGTVVAWWGTASTTRRRWPRRTSACHGRGRHRHRHRDRERRADGRRPTQAGRVRAALARATKKRCCGRTIGLALGIKAVFLALAMFGQATLWMAVFADMGSSLLVVFNGLRLLRKSR
jgi:Cd2+/Zn2+-exporting ATPase